MNADIDGQYGLLVAGSEKAYMLAEAKDFSWDEAAAEVCQGGKLAEFMNAEESGSFFCC